METFKTILMMRDELSEEEADLQIAQARADIMQQIEDVDVATTRRFYDNTKN